MRIHPAALNAVLSHARAAWPQECCGVLLAEDPDGLAVTRVLRAENEEAAAPGRRYILGRKAHIQAVELEVAGRARIAGYYHSHPHGGAEPSVSDAELAGEDVGYLIVGMGGGAPRTAAWRFEDGEFVPEPLEAT